MKHSTYKTLYRVHLGLINEKDLQRSQREETDPFLQDFVGMIITDNYPNRISWDVKPFTTDFRSGSPRQKLDEIFLLFVLRIVMIVKHDSYIRTFQKPESQQGLLAWVWILRSVIYSGLALLYNVKWTDESMMKYLEPAIMKLVTMGDVSALRQLMKDLGINLSQQEPYLAEREFTKLDSLNISQFGSFFWRYLHWMAEAVAIRNGDMNKYKNEWIDLLKGPIYRTLQCGICINHYLNLAKEFYQEMSYERMPRIFFEMHNRTHAFKRDFYKSSKLLQQPDYTEAQYNADSAFMRRALSAAK